MSSKKVKQLNLKSKLAILFVCVAAVISACVLGFNIVSQNNNNAFAEGNVSNGSYTYSFKAEPSNSGCVVSGGQSGTAQFDIKSVAINATTIDVSTKQLNWQIDGLDETEHISGTCYTSAAASWELKGVYISDGAYTTFAPIEENKITLDGTSNAVSNLTSNNFVLVAYFEQTGSASAGTAPDSVTAINGSAMPTIASETEITLHSVDLDGNDISAKVGFENDVASINTEVYYHYNVQQYMCYDKYGTMVCSKWGDDTFDVTPIDKSGTGYLFVGWFIKDDDELQPLDSSGWFVDVKSSDYYAVWSTSNMDAFSVVIPDEYKDQAKMGIYEYDESAGEWILSPIDNAKFLMPKSNDFRFAVYTYNDPASPDDVWCSGGIDLSVEYCIDKDNPQSDESWVFMNSTYFGILTYDSVKPVSYSCKFSKTEGGILPNDEDCVYSYEEIVNADKTITANFDEKVVEPKWKSTSEGCSVKLTYSGEEKIEFTGDIIATNKGIQEDGTYVLALSDKYHKEETVNDEEGYKELAYLTASIDEGYEFDAWIAENHGGKISEGQTVEIETATPEKPLVFTAYAHKTGEEDTTLTVKVDDLGMQNNALISVTVEGQQIDPFQSIDIPFDEETSISSTDYVYCDNEGICYFNYDSDGEYVNIPASLKYDSDILTFTGWKITDSNGETKEVSADKTNPNYLGIGHSQLVANFALTEHPVEPESEDINGTASTGDNAPFVALAVIAMISIAGTFAVARKRRFN